MKCVICIGYTHILLPSTEGVEKLIKTLSKGMETDFYCDSDKTVEVKGPVKIELKLVPDAKPVTMKDAESKRGSRGTPVKTLEVKTHLLPDHH